MWMLKTVFFFFIIYRGNIFSLEFSIYICVMKSKSVKHTLHKMAKASQREQAMEDGFYDGRFRPRVVTPKPHKSLKHKGRRFDED